MKWFDDSLKIDLFNYWMKIETGIDFRFPTLVDIDNLFLFLL